MPVFRFWPIQIATVIFLSISSTWALSFEQISQLAPLKYGPLSTTAGNPSVTAQNVFVASEGSPLRILARLSTNPSEVITECRFTAPAVQNAATPTVYSNKLPSGLSLKPNFTMIPVMLYQNSEGAGAYTPSEAPLYHCELAGVPLPSLTQATNNTFYTITAVTASGRTESETIALDIRPVLRISIPTQLLLLNQVVNTSATVSGYLASEQPYTFVTRRNFSEATRACALAAGEVLPAGLSFDSASCFLRGTPTVLSTMKTARIFVTTTNGRTAEARLAYRVDDSAVVNSTSANSVIRFNPGFYEVQVGSTISVWHSALPLTTTELITSCTLSAGSPAGVVAQLQPDQKSCRIGGAVTAAFSRASITMNLSTNRSRSFSGNIELSVIPKLTIVYPQIRGVASQTLSFRPIVSGIQPGELFGACRLQGETPLPAGLQLDAATCSISGVPTTAVATGSVTRDVVFYSSRAADRWAITTLSFNILPALTVGFAPNPVAFQEGASQSVDAVIPLLSGETIMSCTSSSILPAGLRLGVELTAGARYQKFCKIYGTSNTPTPRTSIPISVRTSLGRIASGNFNLEVRPLNTAVTINDFFLDSPRIVDSSLIYSAYADASRASFMAFTTTASCGGTLNWQTYNPLGAVSLPLAAGTQTVYARFKDLWENLSPCIAVAVTFETSPPSIIELSPNQTLGIGSVLSLSVSARGSRPLTYQWMKNGVDISGATGSGYTRSSVSSADAGSYQVRITNSLGTLTSPAITVTITTAPLIVTQPQPQTLTLGGTLNLSVVAAGTGSLSYQWSKDGSEIAGATSSSFSKANVLISDSGTYRVRVSNSSGSVTSQSANVTVNSAPIIDEQPRTQTLISGTSASLSVTARGSLPLTYQWFKDGSPISSASSSSYSISNVQASHAGAYSVRITNTLGSLNSSTATVAVNSPPVITTQPTSRSVNTGASFSLSVSATAVGAISYQWLKDGTEIPGGTSAVYSVSSANTSMSGSYTCRVSSTLNSTTASTPSSSASVTVSGPPVITEFQSLLTATIGVPVPMTVRASGSGTLTYQWMKAGVNIPYATLPTFTIGSAAITHAGIYSVRVSNTSGSVVSPNLTLTINSAPLLSSQPLSQTINQENPVTFSVTAAASGFLTYQWKRNGTDIGGATTSSFTIPFVQPTDAASYSVAVTSSLGGTTSTTSSSAAVLTVNAPPTISQQPKSATIGMQGDNLRLGVLATAPGTLSYQWKKNGSNLSNGGRFSGATSAALTISGVQPEDGGDYTVSIRSTLNSVVSPEVVSTKASVFIASGSIASTTRTPFVVTAPGHPIRNGMTNEVDFGSMRKTTAATPLTFTIRNASNAAASLSGVTIDRPSDFTLNTVGLVGTLAPGATTSFTLTMKTASAGVRSARIAVNHPTNAALNFTFPVGGLVWGDNIEEMNTNPDPTPVPVAPYDSWGVEVAALGGARTAAQYLAIRPNLTLEAYEQRTITYFQGKGSVAANFVEYMIAAKRNIVSKGAFLAAQNYKAALESANPEDLVALVSIAINSMANDLAARSKLTMALALGRIEAARIPARTFFKAALMNFVVENSGGLNAFGRHSLRLAFFKAYLMTNPLLGEVNQVASTVFGRLSDPISKKPLIDAMVAQFPEILLETAP